MSLRPYYEADGVMIYLGDCREIMPQLDAVDHVITDPPYDKRTHARGGKVKRYDKGPAIEVIPFRSLEDMPQVAVEIGRLCLRWALVFCAVRQISPWMLALEASSMNALRVMVWVKPDASPQFSGDRPGHGFEPMIAAHAKGRSRWNGGGKKGVYTHLRMDRASGFCHPTQKPEKLLSELISDFTDIDDLILDPFAGSGTTAVAAKRLGRRCILIEQEEKYCEIAALRCQQGALDLFPGATR